MADFFKFGTHAKDSRTGLFQLWGGVGTAAYYSSFRLVGAGSDYPAVPTGKVLVITSLQLWSSGGPGNPAYFHWAITSNAVGLNSSGAYAVVNHLVGDGGVTSDLGIMVASYTPIVVPVLWEIPAGYYIGMHPITRPGGAMLDCYLEDV
jgi:hypothetical protein